MKELMNKVWKKEEGFSLIELIIVIAILAIIAAIAVPNLIENIERSNKATDISNAKLIADSVATAVANDPQNAGVAIAQESYQDTAAHTAAVLDAALVTLNGIAPTLKSADFGTTGGDFLVEMDAAGVIKVTAPGVGGSELFPTHP